MGTALTATMMLGTASTAMARTGPTEAQINQFFDNATAQITAAEFQVLNSGYSPAVTQSTLDRLGDLQTTLNDQRFNVLDYLSSFGLG